MLKENNYNINGNGVPQRRGKSLLKSKAKIKIFSDKQ